jgi:septal ring factor EnvC (AmiA/AmiB activator)
MPDKMLTRKQAADLLGCSVDTIRRREGKLYPNAALVDGVTLIPLADLIAAGHYTPAATEDLAQTIARVRDDRETQRLREELALTRIHLDNLEQQLRETRAERNFLRRLIEQGRAA